MTPEQERVLADELSDGVEGDLRVAFAEVLTAIAAGEDPRDAVLSAIEKFGDRMDGRLGDALRQVLAGAIGEALSEPIVVGRISLSSRLYAEASDVGSVVRGIVQRQADGFQDARGLALELYEGYSFREPAAEPLKLSPRNDRLPRYLREAVLTDPGLERDLARALARIQVDGLSTGALQAAYRDVLTTIDAIEAGAGSRVLERKLEVAFFERMRYFANRIARTELHRAYADREARLLMADTAVEFVQVRRAPGRDQPCICSLMTGRNQWGLGPGVYPKARAPVPPFHPFCMCVMSARFDLSGREAVEDEDADVYFLRRTGEGVAGRIVGSRDKAGDVLSGRMTGEQVANSGRDPLYWIKHVGEVA